MNLHPQTKELLRRLKVGAIRAVLRDDRIVFEGGSHGVHSIAAEPEISSPERVVAHWAGYLEVNGVDPRRTPRPRARAPRYWDGHGHKPNARILRVTRRGAKGRLYGRAIYRSGRVGHETALFMAEDLSI